MGELVFVGLGLYNEKSLSIQGLEEIKEADSVFVELYTSLMQGLSFKGLKCLAGKDIVSVSRKMLEEEEGEIILEAARKGKTVFLVPGDPFIATTHIDLRIRAKRADIETRVINGASIISAAIGLSGLQNYKFGRSVTIPFRETGIGSETPCNVIKANVEVGLHTLCFLDIKAEEERYMKIKEALETFLASEKEKEGSAITDNTLVVGIARAGSKSPIVKAGPIGELLEYEFGRPPHTMIFPGKLHFVEADALINLADAPKSIRKLTK